MNVILVIFDTLRYDHIGANGNGWIRTPNFDRFAAEATVFDNCYLASFPTIPHRTDVITGRYGAPANPWLPLRFDALTLPGTLAAGGYATQLLFDTPHLINGGHNFDFPFHAWHFIRDNEVDRHWLDDRDAGLPPEKRIHYVNEEGLVHPAVMQYIRNNRRRSREEEWPSPRLFAAACRWLEDNRRRNNFFLWLDCFDPHEPWDPPPDYIRMYAKDYRRAGDLNVLYGWENKGPKEVSPEQLKRMGVHYAGEVTMIDTWFGKMLARLDALGLAEKTVVIVNSDHGTYLGDHGRLHKCLPLWDQCAHTHLMVRVPGQAGGVRKQEIIQPQDIFPTVCELAGVEVPKAVEGHSFAALLGNTGPRNWPRKVAFSAAPVTLDLRRETPPRVTVQDAEWCLVDSPDSSRRLLYHKPSDPAEEKNVLEENPGVVRELHEKLLAELKTRRAPSALIDWFAAGEKGPLPADYRTRDPYLDSFVQYFTRILPEERN